MTGTVYKTGLMAELMGTTRTAHQVYVSRETSNPIDDITPGKMIKSKD